MKWKFYQAGSNYLLNIVKSLQDYQATNDRQYFGSKEKWLLPTIMDDQAVWEMCLDC